MFTLECEYTWYANFFALLPVVLKYIVVMDTLVLICAIRVIVIMGVHEHPLLLDSQPAPII